MLYDAKDWQDWREAVMGGQRDLTPPEKGYKRSNAGLYIPDNSRALGDDPERLEFPWIISTNSVDRERDTIDQTGWVTDAYEESPTVLFAHCYYALPVGRTLALTKFPDRTRANMTFPNPGVYPFADETRGLVRDGFLRTCSVGFRAFTWVYNEERRGIDFLTQELLEWSICPVPANPEALIQARAMGHDLRFLEEWAVKVLDQADGAERIALPSGGLYLPKSDAARALEVLHPHTTVPVTAAIDAEDMDLVGVSTETTDTLNVPPYDGSTTTTAHRSEDTTPLADISNALRQHVAPGLGGLPGERITHGPSLRRLVRACKQLPAVEHRTPDQHAALLRQREALAAKLTLRQSRFASAPVARAVALLKQDGMDLAALELLLTDLLADSMEMVSCAADLMDDCNDALAILHGQPVAPDEDDTGEQQGEVIEMALDGMQSKGVVPPDVSRDTAAMDVTWSAPSLSDFTPDAWSDIPADEKRHIAGHYAWARAMPPETFGDMKLPHHRAADGFVVWNGVRNAAARLPQSAISASDQASVKAHLGRHYHAFGKTPPWEVEAASWAEYERICRELENDPTNAGLQLLRFHAVQLLFPADDAPLEEAIPDPDAAELLALEWDADDETTETRGDAGDEELVIELEDDAYVGVRGSVQQALGNALLTLTGRLPD